MNKPDNADNRFTIRVPKALAERVERACDRTKNPYAPTRTRLFLRGVELSLTELQKAKK